MSVILASREQVMPYVVKSDHPASLMVVGHIVTDCYASFWNWLWSQWYSDAAPMQTRGEKEGFEKQTVLSPGTQLENVDVCERWCLGKVDKERIAIYHAKTQVKRIVHSKINGINWPSCSISLWLSFFWRAHKEKIWGLYSFSCNYFPFGLRF